MMTAGLRNQSSSRSTQLQAELAPRSPGCLLQLAVPPSLTLAGTQHLPAAEDTLQSCTAVFDRNLPRLQVQQLPVLLLSSSNV